MRISISVLGLASVVFLSGCLKTRTQMRGDPDYRSERGQSAPPLESVEPQGGYAIEEIKLELTKVAGRLDDLERNKSESKEENAPQIQEVLDRLNALESMVADYHSAELYKKAKQAFESKDYKKAISLFDSYLKLPSAEYVQEATFRKGLSYFKLKDYKKAIVEFSAFPEKYPKSRRMPEALLHIGLSFDELGLKADSKGFYLEVIEKYPKSAEAKTAKKKIH